MFKYTKNAFFVLASNVFYTLMYYYSWAQIRTRRMFNLVVPFFKQYVLAYFTKPAVSETETYATHIINWFKDGKLHREDGPAVYWNGCKEYWYNDKCHKSSYYIKTVRDAGWKEIVNNVEKKTILKRLDPSKYADRF